MWSLECRCRFHAWPEPRGRKTLPPSRFSAATRLALGGCVCLTAQVQALARRCAASSFPRMPPVAWGMQSLYPIPASDRKEGAPRSLRQMLPAFTRGPAAVEDVRFRVAYSGTVRRRRQPRRRSRAGRPGRGLQYRERPGRRAHARRVPGTWQPGAHAASGGSAGIASGTNPRTDGAPQLRATAVLSSAKAERELGFRPTTLDEWLSIRRCVGTSR